MGNELEILRQLHRKTFSEAELMDIFYQNRDRYRVLLHLVQQPNFPEKNALNIIPKLYPMDLIRVVKNKRTNPGTRKRAEQEFVNKYNKYPPGEKISYMKIAPNSLLHYFIEENDERILEAILNNAFCTEEVVLKFVNRKAKKFSFYNALCSTEWYKRPQVAFAISHDPQAPIRILVAIIPYLNLKQLEKLYKNEKTHQIVKNNITQYLQKRQSS
ncbi:MAG: hypothetical protein JSV88_25555 [Candidatus Aminicenantes bacterium]|nr:MAG: hypothetical protein JSV88_25555 [Candidatus Aminicenantes bacterium]